MADIKISDMMRMQMNLWEQHKDTWSPMEAEFGRNFILWMMEEMGECIAIIKKKGDSAIMREASVREAFVEEMSDVSVKAPRIRGAPGKGTKTQPRKEGNFRGKAQNIKSG